jgi:hypothetical protein
MATMNLHATVINTIGGRTYVARALGLPTETVKSWSKRGIPARYWHLIVELAAPKMPGLKIADLDLDHARPKAAQEAA